MTTSSKHPISSAQFSNNVFENGAYTAGSAAALVLPMERMRTNKAAFRRSLAQFAGQGRPMSAVDLGAHCGKSAATVNGWLRGETLPDIATGMTLAAVLPVEFSARLLRPCGLSGLYRIGGDGQPGETLREIIEGAAALAAAWADQRIDHTEWPEVERELIEAQVAIAQFLATANPAKAPA